MDIQADSFPGSDGVEGHFVVVDVGAAVASDVVEVDFVVVVVVVTVGVCLRDVKAGTGKEKRLNPQPVLSLWQGYNQVTEKIKKR